MRVSGRGEPHHQKVCVRRFLPLFGTFCNRNEMLTQMKI